MSGLNQQFTKLSSQKWFREFESHILRRTIQYIITAFIEFNKLRAVVELSKSDKKDLLNRIAEVWTEKDGMKFIIPGVNQELFVELTKDKEDYDRTTLITVCGCKRNTES